MFVEDNDEVGVLISLGDLQSDRLDTNSSGMSDFATFALTSQPFGEITLRLVSKVRACERACACACACLCVCSRACVRACIVCVCVC